MQLQHLNAHVRDSRISFKEEGHIYNIDGVTDYTSVTTWIHTLFGEFESDKIIGQILKSQMMLNPEYKYFGMSAEQIKLLWRNNCAAACAAGTQMHNDIERYYNGLEFEHYADEYLYFLNFRHDHMHLEPYRTEWMIFHEEVKICGSIDIVFRDVRDGSFHIYDWKRSKEIVKDNIYNKFAKMACVSHIPDNNFYHYCLQLNLYAWILKEKYNITISTMFLVCLHPNNSNDNYQLHEVVNMNSEIINLMTIRQQIISESKKEKE